MHKKHTISVLFWVLVLTTFVTLEIRQDSGKWTRDSINLPILYGYESSSEAAVCGDGTKEGAEACDDSNTTAGDGCSATCTVESGYSCTDASPSVCSTVCGDEIIAGSEACDDGDTDAGDGCSATCTVETGFSCTGTPSVCTGICGDSLIKGSEGCDDGNTDAGDGCSATCTAESGYSCTGTPSVCSTTCGDGIIAGSEGCDDDNTTNGDGCNASCVVENGFTCTGEPSSCSAACGDGSLVTGEACDDGNSVANDGCDASCAVETGFTCNSSSPTVCTPVCGDSSTVGTEECDDGNNVNTDACINTCKNASCGDGFVRDGVEECEPPATDTCDDSCKIRTGGGGSSREGTTSGRAERRQQAEDQYVPQSDDEETETPTRVRQLLTCGNGKIDLGEECDDGNKEDDDGCSSFCYREIGECGDGIVQKGKGEECEPKKELNEEGNLVYKSIPKCDDDLDAIHCSAPRAKDGGCKIVVLPRCSEDEEVMGEIETRMLSGCGDGRKDVGEECDFGGMCYGGKYHGAIWRDRQAALLCRKHGGMSFSKDGDGCSSDCALEFCGDSIVQYSEQCDNGKICENSNKACKKDSECGKSGKCIYDFKVNEACTPTCELCKGQYSALINLEGVNVGEHLAKVQVSLPCDVHAVKETRFTVSKKLTLTSEGIPTHKLDKNLISDQSKDFVGAEKPLVSVITDKGKYIQDFDKAVLLKIIVADSEGNVIHGMEPSSFKVSLNGRLVEDVLVLPDVSSACVEILSKQEKSEQGFSCEEEKLSQNTINTVGSLLGSSKGRTATTIAFCSAACLLFVMLINKRKYKSNYPECGV